MQQRQQPSTTSHNRMMDAAPETPGSASSNQLDTAGPCAAQHPSCSTSPPGEDGSKKGSQSEDPHRAAQCGTSEQHSSINSSRPRALHEAKISVPATNLGSMARKGTGKKAMQTKKESAEADEMCRRWAKGDCRFGKNCHYRHSREAAQQGNRTSGKGSKTQDDSKKTQWSGWHKANWTSCETKEGIRAGQSASWPTAKEGQHWKNQKWNKAWSEKQGQWRQDTNKQNLAEGIRQSLKAWQDADGPRDDTASGSGTQLAKAHRRSEATTATARANKNSRATRTSRTEAEDAIKFRVGSKCMVTIETLTTPAQSRSGTREGSPEAEKEEEDSDGADQEGDPRRKREATSIDVQNKEKKGKGKEAAGRGRT